ncbi:MAG: hypothetical protein LBI10_13105, partial [Deltaproteobacteria bacterium]|nr:hypothetical protein [Deltaproteobacteria bacterium]
MLCPKCGYNSFDYYPSCPKCRKDWSPVRRQLALTSPEPGVINFFAILGSPNSASLDPTSDFQASLSGPPPVFGEAPNENFIEAEVVSPTKAGDPLKTTVDLPFPPTPPTKA